MTKEEMMKIFEESCDDWGFDFTKNSDGPAGLSYSDFNTGVMCGMFMKGFETSKKMIVQECSQICKDNLLTQQELTTTELNYNDAVGDCAIMIKQHFGVE